MSSSRRAHLSQRAARPSPSNVELSVPVVVGDDRTETFPALTLEPCHLKLLDDTVIGWRSIDHNPWQRQIAPIRARATSGSPLRFRVWGRELGQRFDSRSANTRLQLLICEAGSEGRSIMPPWARCRARHYHSRYDITITSTARPASQGKFINSGAYFGPLAGRATEGGRYL